MLGIYWHLTIRIFEETILLRLRFVIKAYTAWWELTCGLEAKKAHRRILWVWVTYFIIHISIAVLSFEAPCVAVKQLVVVHLHVVTVWPQCVIAGEAQHLITFFFVVVT